MGTNSTSLNGPSLKGHLLYAEERQQEAAWTPPLPTELQALLADRRRRLVRNAGELIDLIVDALREVARSIPEHGQLLWDMHRVLQEPDQHERLGVAA